MAIIDDKHYKLDIYNTRLSNLIFRCSEDEQSRKILAGKLVFYDRDKILDLHAKNLYKREPYNLENLEKLQFLRNGETVDRVVPLDKFWLAVLLKTKKTNEPIMDKVMYISPNGEAYLCDEIEPVFNGYVPESVYLKDASEVPHAVVWLDDKYQDGTHNEFMKKYVNASRSFAERILVNLIKSDGVDLVNKEFKNKEKITLENVLEAVRTEYKRKPRGEDFSFYQILDMMLLTCGAEEILNLEKKYCKNTDEEKTQNSEKIFEK